MSEITATTILRTARDLAADGDDNGAGSEYNRALIEMTADLLRMDPDAGPVLHALFPDPGASTLRDIISGYIGGGLTR